MQVSQRQFEAIIGLSPRNPVERLDLVASQRALLEAARLARRGRYAQAAVLIDTLPRDGPLGPATLDLRAKVFAQQGRFLEAEFCWMEALRQSPGNPGYRRALECLTRSRSPRGPMRWLLPLVVAALLVTVLGVIAKSRIQDVLASQVAADTKHHQAVQDLSAQQKVLAGDLKALGMTLQEGQQDQKQAVKDLRASVDDLCGVLDATVQSLAEGRTNDTRATAAALAETTKAIDKVRSELAQTVRDTTSSQKAATDELAKVMGDLRTRLGGQLDDLTKKVEGLAEQVAMMESHGQKFSRPPATAPALKLAPKTQPQ